MRIIAGKFKGRKLQRPPESITRPTTDRVRESIFNILSHLDGFDFVDSCVLDLFAGSGAMGLEALSRGAVDAFFVDKSSVARQIIMQNIHHLKVEESGHVVAYDALNLPVAEKPVDLVFIDPPYSQDLELKVLGQITSKNWTRQGTIIVLETSKRTALELPKEDFSLLTSRHFSNTTILILRRIRQELFI